MDEDSDMADVMDEDSEMADDSQVDDQDEEVKEGELSARQKKINN